MTATNIQQDLITQLGIDQLPEEKQAEVLSAMTEVFLKHLAVRVLGKLSEEQRKAFEETAAAGDPEKLTQFLAANVPNYEAEVADEISQFKKEMAETVDGLLAA